MAHTANLAFMTTLALRDLHGIRRLLDGLESVSSLVPTHWGLDERARDTYERSVMERTVCELIDDHYVPGFVRRRSPRYEGYFSAQVTGLNYVKLQFGAPSGRDLSDVFALGDAMAASLETEYGFVHRVWNLGEISQLYSEAGVIQVDEFQQCGPQSLATRTWFGAHIAALLDRSVLRESGALVRDTPWGGIQVDLVEAPWETDFETLRRRQMEIMALLQSSGVFGDYSVPFECRPGPQWIPIPIGSV